MPKNQFASLIHPIHLDGCWSPYASRNFHYATISLTLVSERSTVSAYAHIRNVDCGMDEGLGESHESEVREQRIIRWLSTFLRKEHRALGAYTKEKRLLFARKARGKLTKRRISFALFTTGHDDGTRTIWCEWWYYRPGPTSQMLKGAGERFFPESKTNISFWCLMNAVLRDAKLDCVPLRLYVFLFLYLTFS